MELNYNVCTNLYQVEQAVYNEVWGFCRNLRTKTSSMSNLSGAGDKFSEAGNRFLRIGPYLYAAAIGAFGVIQLVTHNFLTGLLPVAATLPLRWFWMDLSSAVLLLASAGILFKIRPQVAAVVRGIVVYAFLFCFAIT